MQSVCALLVVLALSIAVDANRQCDANNRCPTQENSENMEKCFSTAMGPVCFDEGSVEYWNTDFASKIPVADGMIRRYTAVFQECQASQYAKIPRGQRDAPCNKCCQIMVQPVQGHVISGYVRDLPDQSCICAVY